jgi:hypothetical protein
MYWTRFPERNDLEGGHVLAHGMTRLTLAAPDLATFVDPPDAALAFGFRALNPEDTFETSYPVWMATLRRRTNDDAIVESAQPVFTELADEDSLVNLLADTCERARALQYRKVWLAPGLFKEPLFAPALKRIVQSSGRPLEYTPSTGMAAIVLC